MFVAGNRPSSVSYFIYFFASFPLFASSIPAPPPSFYKFSWLLFTYFCNSQYTFSSFYSAVWFGLYLFLPHSSGIPYYTNNFSSSFFISIHLTSNRCQHLLSILPLSFTCCLILIICSSFTIIQFLVTS
jgi:hypothetical protein